MQRVTLVTDGACIGNPGPGGWACILRHETQHRELFGSEEHTTNNRMEMRAVIEGLMALKGPSRIIVTTDSQYVRNGITKWIAQWKRQLLEASAGVFESGAPGRREREQEQIGKASGRIAGCLGQSRHDGRAASG